MSEHTTAVAVDQKKPPQTFSDVMMLALNDVEEALPANFNKQRFVQEAVALMNDNEQLAKFAKQNGTGLIKLGMLKAAYMGLSFASKEAYLIPYGSKLEFQTDYKGERKLAKKYSARPIKEIYAKLVREGDDFNMDIIDGRQTVSYKPVVFNNKPILGAFAICEYEDGGLLVETMSKDEIDMVRSKSRSQNGAAWKDFYGEMAKKSVLRRLTKGIDYNWESAYQVNAYESSYAEEYAQDEPDLSDPFANANIIDSEAKDVTDGINQ